MEENLIKAIEEKIEKLEQTENQRVDEMEKEQKIDMAYEKLNKQKEECLTEIRNNGAGSREASEDLEKIEAELEKLKLLEKEIVNNIEKEISDEKANLSEVKEIIDKKENAQRNKEIAEKNIERLNEHKEECLAEIRNHGSGSKEASADLEKIEAELEKNIKTKEQNEKIIEEFDKKINDFAKMYEIKEATEKKLEDEEKEIIENQNQEENEINEEKVEKQDNRKEEVVKENTVYNKDEKVEKQDDRKEETDKKVNDFLKMRKVEDEKNKIILNIGKNEININGKEKAFYIKESKNKKDIIERYGINNYFINDKKKKNIDYALISTLEKIGEKQNDNQGTLVKAYLNIIKGGNIGEYSLEKSMKLFKDTIDIEYKFDKDVGILTNWKEKRIARNAKKLGIASLDGISEKSILDKIKEGFFKDKNIKFLKGREKTKALGDGQKTNAQIQKERVLDMCEKENFRQELKVNKDMLKREKVNNSIEQNLAKDVKEIMSEEDLGEK